MWESARRIVTRAAGVSRFEGKCRIVFFSSRRRHTRYWRDWSSDVCSSDLAPAAPAGAEEAEYRELHFPVEGAVTFGDDFGDPRSGGRSHAGNDLMGTKMQKLLRSEERRVGKEGRSRWSPYHLKKKRGV